MPSYKKGAAAPSSFLLSLIFTPAVLWSQLLDSDFYDRLMDLAITHQRRMGVLREEDTEAPSRGRHPCLRRVGIEGNILFDAVWSDDIVAIGGWPPAHLLVAGDNVLDVDVAAVALQLRLLAGATAGTLNQHKQLITIDDVTAGGKRVEIGAAQEFEGRRKARMQRRVAFGVGQNVGDHRVVRVM